MFSRIRMLRANLAAALMATGLLIGQPALGDGAVAPGHADSLGQIRKVGLLPLDIKIVEVFPGDLVEKRDDWSNRGAEVTRQILQDFFANIPMELVNLTDREMTPQYDDVLKLYERVALTINYGVFELASPFSMPGKQEEFDYALGDVSELFVDPELDAILIVSGRDAHLTTSRKISEGASAAFKILFGVVDYTNPEGSINIALVNRDGEILWYGSRHFTGTDFREYNIHQYLVGEALKTFPLQGQ